MHHIKKMVEITIEAENKPGLLAEVTGALSNEGVNISTLCAYSMEDKAFFMMITSDNGKVEDIAGKKGWKTIEREVVTVALKNEVGAAKGIAEKVKDIDLCYAYGTNCSCEEGKCDTSCESRIVLCAENAADKIVAALK